MCHNVTPVIEDNERENDLDNNDEEEEEVLLYSRSSDIKTLSFQASSPDEVRIVHQLMKKSCCITKDFIQIRHAYIVTCIKSLMKF